MPHSELHKQKLKKNLAVLGMIAALCVLLVTITVIKVSGQG